MNRRVFFSSLVLASGSLVLRECPAFMPVSEIDRNLKSGEVFVTEPGLRLGLPSNPQDGDSIHLVIDTTAVENPSILSYQQRDSIVGDKESLILDSLGNIKLTYRAQTKNWELA